jgi:cobalt-precorrin 5A hydrolase
VTIGAIGLYLRILAPSFNNKREDPAVVGLGEDGRYAVSLLSGHLGRANELAKDVAKACGAEPVITTATDLANQPALEVLAQKAGLKVVNWPNLAPIARALVEGALIQLNDPTGYFRPFLAVFAEKFVPFTDPSLPSVWVGYEAKIPEKALVLRPPVLTIGLGAHRNVPAQDILPFIEEVFRAENLSLEAVKTLATIDRRASEAGFQELARSLNVDLVGYPPEKLNAVPTPNPSEVVKKNIGVLSVCEAAALLAAPRGTLIVPKRKSSNLTLAVARIDWTSLA